MKPYLSPVLAILSPYIGVWGNSWKKLEKILGNHFYKDRNFGKNVPLLNMGKNCQKKLIVRVVKSRDLGKINGD